MKHINLRKPSKAVMPFKKARKIAKKSAIDISHFEAARRIKEYAGFVSTLPVCPKTGKTCELLVREEAL